MFKLIKGPQDVREDDFLIEFEDTRNFAAEKWSTAVEAQDITAADWQRAKSVDKFEEYRNWLRNCIKDSQNARQRNHLQSLLVVAPPLYSLTVTFEKLVAPAKAEMWIIWGLVFLNINLAIPQNEKLKWITPWLQSLKRCVEALNQCIENSVDENSARTQITEIFDPLLQLLTGIMKYQRTYVADTDFARALSTMKEFVKENIEWIDEIIKHFRQMVQNSKASLETTIRHEFRGSPFGEHKNPYDRAAFPVETLPKTRIWRFYGRENSLERIETHLGNQNLKKLRTYLIYGLRGVGKTQLALEFATRYRAKYDAVFWIRCETSASLRQSFSDIAIRLELSTADQVTRFEENQIKVLEWLKKTDRTWLLIYDNAERDQALNAYWPRDAVGSVLLTSRSYYNFEHQERRDGETIPVFSEDERWDLLMGLLGPEWQTQHLEGVTGPQEYEAARKLLTHLGGLPLAISQASKLVLDTRLNGDQSIATLLTIFENTKKELPQRISGHRNEKILAFYTIWAVALNNVSRNARSLLGVLSLLEPDSIPVDLFLPADQSRLDGKLSFCKQDAIHSTALEMSSEMKTAVVELKKADLIRQDGRSFVIHRVVQDAMNFVNINDLQDSFNAATEILREAFPVQRLGRPLHDVWPRCQTYVQHVVHLTKAFAKYQKDKQGYIASTAALNFIRVLSNCGWYLLEVADYNECVNMMNVACSATIDKTSLLYSHLLNTTGAAYYEQNKIKKARQYFAEARCLREQHLKPNHPQIAAILANIGNCDSSDGNLDEAQALFEKAVRIREAYNDEEILALGVLLMQLGRVASLRDENDLAEEHYDKAETCFLRTSNKSQYPMASLHYARGNLELGRRDFDQAIAQYNKCSDICHSLFPVHPLAAAAFYKLAMCDIRRGQQFHDKARLNLEKAYNVASIRSNGEIDGTVARIQWRRAEMLIDDPVQKEQGLEMRARLKTDLQALSLDLGLQLPSEWTSDEALDMFVPGYFR